MKRKGWWNRDKMIGTNSSGRILTCLSAVFFAQLHRWFAGNFATEWLPTHQLRTIMHATLPLLQATEFPVLHRGKLETLQVNLCYQCNQSCLHCHVNAGANRKEMMAEEAIELIPQVLAARKIGALDLTGGAP